MKKLLTMLLSIVMLLGVAVPVSAAGKTPVLKAEGDYTIQMEKGDATGKLKFKAPDAGTYNFNMYELCFDGEYDVSDSDPYFTSASSKYDRTIKVKATKGKKTLINTKLANFHKRLVLIKKGSGSKYKSLIDVAQDYLNISTDTIDELTRNYKQRDEFSVKLKKGEVVTLTFTGDKKASILNLSIYKE